MPTTLTSDKRAKGLMQTCDMTCPDCGNKACGMTTCKNCKAEGLVGPANCIKCVGKQMMDASNDMGQVPGDPAKAASPQVKKPGVTYF